MKQKIIVCFAVCSGLYILAESLVYFSTIGNNGMEVLYLSICNLFCGFTFSTDAVSSDLTATLGADTVSVFREYAYLTALTVAPLCAAAAVVQGVYHIVELRLRRAFHGVGHIVAVFGDYDQCMDLLDNKEPKQTYYLFTKEAISDETQLRLSRRGVYVFVGDFINRGYERMQEVVTERGIKCIDHVLLLHQDGAENVSLYFSLSQGVLFQRKNVSFHMLCREEGLRGILSEYHNSKSAVNRNVTIIDTERLKMMDLYDNKGFRQSYLERVRTVSPETLDVHILVVGLANLGMQTLRYIINDGVLTACNTITIDVVDQEYLADRFYDKIPRANQDFSDWTQRLDGRLEVRFHQKPQLTRRLLAQITDNNPLSYVLVSGNAASDGMDTLIVLADFLKDEGSVPIAIEIDTSAHIGAYIQNNQARFNNVTVMEDRGQVMNLKQITNPELEKRQRRFHRIYSYMGNMFQPSQEQNTADSSSGTGSVSDWDSLNFYKKESNRFVSYHQEVKTILLAEDMVLFSGWRKAMRDCFGSDLLERVRQRSAIPAYVPQVVASLEDNPQVYELMAMEHRRWNYYVLLQGWDYGDVKDETTCRTPYLTDYKTLLENYPQIACYDVLPYLAMLSEEQEREDRI